MRGIYRTLWGKTRGSRCALRSNDFDMTLPGVLDHLLIARQQAGAEGAGGGDNDAVGRVAVK